MHSNLCGLYDDFYTLDDHAKPQWYIRIRIRYLLLYFIGGYYCQNGVTCCLTTCMEGTVRAGAYNSQNVAQMLPEAMHWYWVLLM